MVIDITNENYDQEINKTDLPIVLDVYASWCGPCQQMTPVFHDLAEKHAGKYKFAKLNVDEARDISIQLGVTSVPTFIFIYDQEVKGKETGYMSKEDLESKIFQHLGKK